MKNGLASSFVIFVLLLMLCRNAYGQGSVIYTIQVVKNGSAAWTIQQSGTEVQVTTDTVVEFERNVTALVEAAENATGRQMAANTSITYTVSGPYVAVLYEITWQNFSILEGAEIKIGDVFKVPDFFLRLYGDGKVYLTYPDGYAVETVSPPPYNPDDAHQTLEWLGTANFVQGLPSIILKEKPAGPLEILSRNSLAVASLVAAVAGFSVAVYLFRRRKRRGNIPASKPETASPMIESDEEKIVRLLKASGGTLHQTVIVEQTKFSKAKTSQLLTILEKKGTVRREKKGRDKIVTIVKNSLEGKNS